MNKTVYEALIPLIGQSKATEQYARTKDQTTRLTELAQSRVSKVRAPIVVDDLETLYKRVTSLREKSHDNDLLFFYTLCVTGFRQTEILQQLQLDSIKVKENNVIEFIGLAK